MKEEISSRDQNSFLYQAVNMKKSAVAYHQNLIGLNNEKHTQRKAQNSMSVYDHLHRAPV